jgi:hypothetical protein
MKKTVSKKSVIEALMTEPLMRGNWIEFDDLISDPQKVKAKDVVCEVCAVGGVLRKNGATIKEIDDYGDRLLDLPFPVGEEATEKDIEYLLKHEQYLSALSAYFESTLPGPRIRYGNEHRERLVRFVEKHFPDRIKL